MDKVGLDGRLGTTAPQTSCHDEDQSMDYPAGPQVPDFLSIDVLYQSFLEGVVCQVQLSHFAEMGY